MISIKELRATFFCCIAEHAVQSSDSEPADSKKITFAWRLLKHDLARPRSLV